MHIVDCIPLPGHKILGYKIKSPKNGNKNIDRIYKFVMWVLNVLELHVKSSGA
jgi:hypothetical protein